MPMVWNDAAISKLYCGILITTEVNVDYEKLAEYMVAGKLERPLHMREINMGRPDRPHLAVEFLVQKMKAEKASNLADTRATNTSKAVESASLPKTPAWTVPIPMKLHPSLRRSPRQKSRMIVTRFWKMGPDSTIRQQKAKVKDVELDGTRGTSWKGRKEHTADESQAGEQAKPAESVAVTP